jgi:hypothetical protein
MIGSNRPAPWRRGIVKESFQQFLLTVDVTVAYQQKLLMTSERKPLRDGSGDLQCALQLQTF